MKIFGGNALDQLREMSLDQLWLIHEEVGRVISEKVGDEIVRLSSDKTRLPESRAVASGRTSAARRAMFSIIGRP